MQHHPWLLEVPFMFHLQHAPSLPHAIILNSMKHRNRNDEVNIVNQEDGMDNTFCSTKLEPYDFSNSQHRNFQPIIKVILSKCEKAKDTRLKIAGLALLLTSCTITGKSYNFFTIPVWFFFQMRYHLFQMHTVNVGQSLWKAVHVQSILFYNERKAYVLQNPVSVSDTTWSFSNFYLPL